jgi:hypothetical protein
LHINWVRQDPGDAVVCYYGDVDRVMDVGDADADADGRKCRCNVNRSHRIGNDEESRCRKAKENFCRSFSFSLCTDVIQKPIFCLVRIKEFLISQRRFQKGYISYSNKFNRVINIL